MCVRIVSITLPALFLLRLGLWFDLYTMLGGQKSVFSSAIVFADAGYECAGCIAFQGPVPG